MRLSKVRDLDPNLLWTMLTYSGFQLPRHQLHCVMVVIWVHRAGTLSSLSLLIFNFRDFIQWFQQVACGRGICSHVITILSTDNSWDSLVTASLSKSTSPSASRFSGAIALWSWFRSSSKLATVYSTSSTIPFKWVIMAIHSTFLSFQWNSRLSETASNCLLSHLTQQAFLSLALSTYSLWLWELMSGPVVYSLSCLLLWRSYE